MLCTVPTLRTAALGCRMQSLFPTPPPSYYTTAAPSLHDSRPTARQVSLPKRYVSFKRPTFGSVRAVSTASQSDPSQATTIAYENSKALDWNTFFKLRRTRRFFQLGSSVSSGVGGFVLGASVLSRSDMANTPDSTVLSGSAASPLQTQDSLVSQIPLDPFITLGLICFSCGGVGWLMGPIVGTTFFNWRIGKTRKQQMGEKEVEFYKRVKKYRVDPTGGSVANPVPDYYGEKIASVVGYRQWLKDQRAFNKKRHTYV